MPHLETVLLLRNRVRPPSLCCKVLFQNIWRMNIGRRLWSAFGLAKILPVEFCSEPRVRRLTSNWFERLLSLPWVRCPAASDLILPDTVLILDTSGDLQAFITLPEEWLSEVWLHQQKICHVLLPYQQNIISAWPSLNPISYIITQLNVGTFVSKQFLLGQ